MTVETAVRGWKAMVLPATFDYVEALNWCAAAFGPELTVNDQDEFVGRWINRYSVYKQHVFEFKNASDATWFALRWV